MTDLKKDELIEEELKKISSNFELDILRLIKTQSMLSLSQQVVDTEFKTLTSKSELIQNKLDELSTKVDGLRMMMGESDSSINAGFEEKSKYFDELKKIIDDNLKEIADIRSHLNTASLKANEKIDSLQLFYKSELEAYKEQIDLRLGSVKGEFSSKLENIETNSQIAETKDEKSDFVSSVGINDDSINNEINNNDAKDDNYLKLWIAGLILGSLILFSALYIMDFRGIKSLVNSLSHKNDSLVSDIDQNKFEDENTVNSSVDKEPSALEKNEIIKNNLNETEIEDIDKELLNKDSSSIQSDSKNLDSDKSNSANDLKEKDIFVGNSIITTNRANYREGPGKEFNVIGVLAKGDEVLSLEETKGIWIKIKTKEGTQGWVALKFLKKK